MKQRLKNQNGTTLVELIVCMVLLAIFTLAAVTLIQPSAQAYMDIQQQTRAQNLADALIETIRGEVLEANGYSVGIISQPDWKDENSISIFGEPRLGFLVSSGNMDSMVNHYTVAKKHRKTDAFTPGGVMGKRPDRAVTVYGNLIRRTYKHTPMILGGIEASLRRLSHYDYWSDQVRRSVLLDSGADLISYGMGELSIVAIADALAAGIDVHDVTFIPGTVYRSKTLDHLIDPVVLPSFEAGEQADVCGELCDSV